MMRSVLVAIVLPVQRWQVWHRYLLVALSRARFDMGTKFALGALSWLRAKLISSAVKLALLRLAATSRGRCMCGPVRQ